MSGEGHAGINDLMSALHGQFPGHGFRRTSGIDTHNGRLRFSWELVGPDGIVALEGLDVGELTRDGRLASVTGFFGPLPAV
jgi:hypothetical protein